MLDPVCLNVRVCCIYVYVCMFVCKYQRVFAKLVYLHISDYDCPFRRICRRLAPNYSLTFTHTHKGKHTRAHVFRADTLTHTSHHHLLLLLRHFPPLLLLSSQEYAVAYASLFRWFFMLLLRLVYGLHYMPYHALTVSTPTPEHILHVLVEQAEQERGSRSAFFFIFIAIPTCLLC